MSLYDLCQTHNTFGQHSLQKRFWYHLRRNLAVRGQFRRRFGRYKVGKPSRFVEGQWVRILDKERIQKTLDARSCLRGLHFLPDQMTYCGRVFRVQKVMRSIVDDQGMFRAISGTVLLEGIDCSGPLGTSGCGRNCPIMFRDEWLESASAPVDAVPIQQHRGFVRVRPGHEIQATLDGEGKCDGVVFMPEMYRWAGQRFPVYKEVNSVFELPFGQYATPPKPLYILEGLRCSGAILGSKGPCDRACRVLWHSDWITREG